MFKTAFSLMALVPAVLVAQVAAGASAQSHTKADARIGKGTSASVESSTSADAASVFLPRRRGNRRRGPTLSLALNAGGWAAPMHTASS